jgi:hypothetical protein
LVHQPLLVPQRAPSLFALTDKVDRIRKDAVMTRCRTHRRRTTVGRTEEAYCDAKRRTVCEMRGTAAHMTALLKVTVLLSCCPVVLLQVRPRWAADPRSVCLHARSAPE